MEQNKPQSEVKGSPEISTEVQQIIGELTLKSPDNFRQVVRWPRVLRDANFNN